MTSSYRAAQRAEDLVNRLIDQGWSTHEIAAEMRRRGAYKRTAAADPTADFCASVRDMVADFAAAAGQPIGDVAALRTRAEAAEQRADLYGRFVQATGFLVGIEVYSPDDLPVISERLGDLCARAEAAEQRAEAAEAALAAARAEVARLRAAIGDAAVELPVWPDGAYQTPTERDVSAVRAGLYAALEVTR